MREVDLLEMLDARDRRAKAQAQLLARHGKPILSFTMNIPGPVKDSPLIRRAFDLGLDTLKTALAEAGITMLSPEETRAVTGCEFLCATDTDAGTIKALCQEIEDGSPMGRLFDMDVIASDGHKLTRTEERHCLVCGKAGRGCASRRLHTLDELRAVVTGLLREGLLEADAGCIESLAVQALLEEAYTTPKPGLVDRNNNGSHRDMTIETLQKSAVALRDYWPDCFRIGVRYGDAPPEECFRELRECGLKAEELMYAATGGINTHKGAIFLLGTVCGAIGRLWRPDSPCRDATQIARECAALCGSAMEADFTALERRGFALSAGERLYLEFGERGVRGELAAGLPGVIDCALPALNHAMAEGTSRNDAGAIALLRLIARGTDSNMVKRGGRKKAYLAAKAAAALLPQPSRAEIEALDAAFIADNLSPGGCADLLAISYFLLDWKGQTNRTPKKLL